MKTINNYISETFKITSTTSDFDAEEMLNFAETHFQVKAIAPKSVMNKDLSMSMLVINFNNKTRKPRYTAITTGKKSNERKDKRNVLMSLIGYALCKIDYTQTHKAAQALSTALNESGMTLTNWEPDECTEDKISIVAHITEKYPVRIELMIKEQQIKETFKISSNTPNSKPDTKKIMEFANYSLNIGLIDFSHSGWHLSSMVNGKVLEEEIKKGNYNDIITKPYSNNIIQNKANVVLYIIGSILYDMENYDYFDASKQLADEFNELDVIEWDSCVPIKDDKQIKVISKNSEGKTLFILTVIPE